MKKIFFLLTLTILVFSCNSNKLKFKKHESGFSYCIVESNENGKKLNLGNLILLEMSYETKDGTILFNSKGSDRNYLRTITEPSRNGGSIEEGLLLLSEGDSAIFKISAEDFLIHSEGFLKLPKGVEPEDEIIIKLRIIDILDINEQKVLLTERFHKDEKTEMNLLDNYLNITNVTEEPKESGLYYIELEKGSGKQAQTGDIVFVDYTVKLIDGDLIETSLGKKPISFKLGTGQVIPAWEEGLQYMHEGGKARLIAPSKIAYGDKGSGKIQPYSTIIFDIELIRIQ
jgi:hypothetical protein